MKSQLQIIGNGSFGTFLKSLLADQFEIVDDAKSVILAVPISAYDEVASKYCNHHLINVCSVQKPSTDACLKYTTLVTSIHPLFGKRTPADKRFSIITRSYQLANEDNDTWWYDSDNPENVFMRGFRTVSTVFANDMEGMSFTPESHDILMAKAHGASVMAAKQLKVFTDRVQNVPDFLLPNSFRLMREFVKTLDDMPHGTIESIMANPYL
jgi:prephenate dehydrogenase